MIFGSFAVCFLLATKAGAGLTQTLSHFANVNITRMEQFDDLFTNPNRMAVLNCAQKGLPADLGSCKHFASSQTNAHCQTSRDCCNRCQCNHGFPTYLMHLAKCVTDLQLANVFQNQDCHFRLSGSVSDDHSEGVNPHDEDQEAICRPAHWFPTVGLGTSLNVRLCKHLSRGVKMTSCSVRGGRFHHLGQWRQIVNAPSIFPIHQKGRLFILKPEAEGKRYKGRLISLEVTCYVNKARVPVSSCVTFKSAGIQTEITSIAPVSYKQYPTIPRTTTVTSSTSSSPELSTTSSSTLYLVSESSNAPAVPTEEGSALNAVAMTTAAVGFGRQQRKRDATAILVPLLCGTFSIAVFVSGAICLVWRIKPRGGTFANSRNEVSPSAQFVLEPNETFEHQYEQADTIIPALALADCPIALNTPTQPGSVYQHLQHADADGLSSGNSSLYTTLKSGKPNSLDRSDSTHNEQEGSGSGRTDTGNIAVYQGLNGRTEAVSLTQKHDLHDGRMYQSLVQPEEVQLRDPEPYYVEIQAPDECVAVEEALHTDEEPYYYKLEPDSP